MKKWILLMVAVSLSVQSYATAQRPDKIIYQGQEFALHSNPLEAYFGHFPDKRPTGGITSTGLWRGYVATFEVIDGQLFVVDIEVEKVDLTAVDSYSYKWVSVMDEVFPDQPEVKVDWLTGLLVIPRGELVNYVHMGYAATYSEYTLLEFHNGDLTEEMTFDLEAYERFKEKQFQAFKQTEEYQRLIDEYRQSGYVRDEEFMDGFLREFVIEYSSQILTD